jgi:hypothetical protein
MGIFPVLLIYGYREVTSTYDISIGIIPAQGYRQEEKHSIKAMQWIKYLSTEEGFSVFQFHGIRVVVVYVW